MVGEKFDCRIETYPKILNKFKHDYNCYYLHILEVIHEILHKVAIIYLQAIADKKISKVVTSSGMEMMDIRTPLKIAFKVFKNADF